MCWEATLAALQRQALRGNLSTRSELIAKELRTIIAAIGLTGTTPAQTLSRVLQELRDEGVLIFDGQRHYRIADGVVQ